MLSYNVATNQYVAIAPDSVQSEEEEEPKAHNTSNVSNSWVLHCIVYLCDFVMKSSIQVEYKKIKKIK